MKAIRAGRQVAIVAVLLEPFLQCLHLLTQQRDLLLHLGNLFISLHQLLLQQAFFFSELEQFFLGSHATTVSALPFFDKPCRTPE